MNNLFMYWVGKKYKLIKILNNIIKIHSKSGNGYTIHMINKKNIGNYIQDIPIFFDTLSPPHQADIVRVYVIEKYGGIWLDCDTIVLGSLDTLFDMIEHQDGFFIKENNVTLCNGVFGSKKNTQLMIEWKTQINSILYNNNGQLRWGEIGGNLLEKMYKNNNNLYSKYNIINGLDTVYPVNWNECVHEFLEKPYDNYKTLKREYQPIIILVNSVYKYLENNQTKNIINGNMPLNYFLNLSN